MMNRLQFLLTKLAEEANEVGQMSLKVQQFGLDECYQEESNKERLHGELQDLFGIIDLLNEEFGFDFKPSKVAAHIKKQKVDKYYKYSQSLGMVE